MNTFFWTGIMIFVFGVVIYLLSGNWKKAVLIISGWGVYEIITVLYDFILWPFVQVKYGATSIIYLSMGAMTLNFLVLIQYQKSGVDWLGVNYLEEIKKSGRKWSMIIYEHKNGLVKTLMYIPAKALELVLYLLNKNDVLAFLVLSIWKDSFVTTAFLRHGKFGSLDKRDYKIFVTSTLLGCFAWSVIVGVGLGLLKVIENILF